LILGYMFIYNFGSTHQDEQNGVSHLKIG